MSALAAETAETIQTSQQPRLVLVRSVTDHARVDLLASSGALLLALTILVGGVDVVRVWNGATPLGLTPVLLLMALPGLTRWAHRLDRRRAR